jgi:hypothetical protein
VVWWERAAAKGSIRARRNLESFRTFRHRFPQPSLSSSSAAAAAAAASSSAPLPRRHLLESPEAEMATTTQKGLLRKRFFDVIVYANAHRGLPLWHAVMAAGYAPSQVIAFNGEDWHGWKQVEEQQAEFGILDRTSYFLREFPDGCPTGEAIDQKFMDGIAEKRKRKAGAPQAR